MKVVPGILASLIITVLIGAVMFFIGGNAFLNTTTVPVNNAPQSSGSLGIAAQAGQSQNQQYENLIKQYQQREKQYQAELNSAAQKLNEANAQVETYQQLLDALQQRGVIQITEDGQVLLPRRRGDSGGSFLGGDN